MDDGGGTTLETLRIGFIGAGGMGNHHAHEVARRENARVAALCDPSPQARERLLKTLGAAAEGVKAYALPEEMLAAEQLHAVVITTPHTQHADHVRAALITGLEPKRVQAFINQEGTLVDVQTAVAVEFTNGAVGSLSYTSLSPEWREEFTFYGTDGVMRFGAAESLRVTRRGEDTILPRPARGGKAPLQNFPGAVEGEAAGQGPPICGLR